MKKLTKVIHFSREFQEEYNYIKTISNASAYICKLIRADIRNKSAREEIKDIILEVINEKGLNLSTIKDETKEKEQKKDTNKDKKNKFVDPMDSDDDEF